MIHEYHVDEFTTHLNSLDSNIKFTTEPEQDGRLPFLDACVNINEDGSTHVTVYRKPTHTDQYLNFASNHHLQHKRSVVRTLMKRAEVMVTRPECRRKEMAHVQDALKTNGYKTWMFKVPRPKQQQSTTSTGTRPKSNVGLPYMQGTSEALTRVFKAHGVGTYGTIGPLTPFDPCWYILRTKHLTPRNVVWCTRWSALNAPSHTSVRQAGC